MISTSAAFTIVLVLNAVWFGMAFAYFSLTPGSAAKLIIPQSQRDSPLLETLVASLRFLGGMNLAFGCFAILLLANRFLFAEPKQRALFLVVFSLAHASQFACNLPVILGKSRARPLWPVLRGPMLLIFTVDLVLALANGVLAITLRTTASGGV